MDFDLEETEKIRIGKLYPRPLQLCRRRSLGYSSQKRLLIFDTNIIIIANRVGRSFIYTFAQCCGAGGAEIIWDLEPEPKLIFTEHFLQSVWRMLR